MGNVVVFLLAVLLANVSGWGACRSFSNFFTNDYTNCMSGDCSGITTNTPNCSDVLPQCGNTSGCSATQQGGGGYWTGLYSPGGSYCGNEGTCYTNRAPKECWYSTFCDTKDEADSTDCVNKGNQWVGGANPECKPQGPPTPPPEGCTYCEDYLGWAEEENPAFGSINIQVPYSKMYHCSTCYKDDNGYIISAGDCTEMRNSPGTCQQNGDCPSNQICADSTGNDSPVECIATIGPNVWLRDVKTGNTFKCEADGDCARAKQLVATGECKNPYADKNKPNSSDSGNSSSSGENPNSSGSENPPESSGEFCDMCDKLERIAANTQATMNNTSDISQWTLETMNKTIDIDNHLTEMGVDVSHIRTNTEATATNTGSIDNKLNTTNSLLNDIKNKNWNPTINVQAPEVNIGGDTIIVNADTAKAPSEILGFLKGLFGGMDTTGSYDTTGWGNVNDTAKSELDSALKRGSWTESLNCDTTGGNKCDHSIIGAHGLDSVKNSLRASYRALADTIKNGSFGDSLQNWGSKFTGGSIAGSGSDNCPSVLSRNYHITLVQGASFDLTLGRYLCQPLVGNTTAWSLCRLLLRACVDLSCMWFLFHCAVGFSGRGGDDD